MMRSRSGPGVSPVISAAWPTGSQAGHFPGVFHGGGKDHHPFAVFGELHDLADNMRRDTLLFFQLMVKIGFAEQAVALRLACD